MGQEIITRRAAYARREKFFYTGKPCKYDHYAARYVSSGNCVECVQGFKPRSEFSGVTRELKPYNPVLWVPAALVQVEDIEVARERRIALRHYLQQSIFEFSKARGVTSMALVTAQEVYSQQAGKDFRNPGVNE